MFLRSYHRHTPILGPGANQMAGIAAGVCGPVRLLYNGDVKDTGKVRR